MNLQPSDYAKADFFFTQLWTCPICDKTESHCEHLDRQLEAIEEAIAELDGSQHARFARLGFEAKRDHCSVCGNCLIARAEKESGRCVYCEG